MSAVVLGVHPTVQAASQAPKETLRGSTTARSNTRDRLEPGGAAALGRDSAARAAPVVKAVRARHPRGCPGEHITGLEG